MTFSVSWIYYKRRNTGVKSF